MKNAGKVVSREDLLREAWGWEYLTETKTVDTHIKRLRDKIEQAGYDPGLVETVRGYGYRFKAMLAAERGVTLVAKDYMHMALHAMEIPEQYKDGLEKAFAATHDNASWILNAVDRATPNPDNLHWDI
jgi:DNA-binding winged helix-turn-helix (wHTH) protein